MKYLLLFLTGIFLINSYGQQMIIETGGIYLGKNSVLNIHNMSIKNNSELTGLDSSVVAFYVSQTEAVLTGTTKSKLYHLSVNGSLKLDAELDLKGDITVTDGNLDISDYNLNLNGKIIGESEENRIYTNSIGEIIKLIQLQPDQAINPGNIGLELKVYNDVYGVEIRRGHFPQFNGTGESINRYYSISGLDELARIDFNYFDAELNNLNESHVTLWGEQQGHWINLGSSLFSIEENYHIQELKNATNKITLFENIQENIITIPSGISPNNDGVNDYFVIIGIENYPNNKLIILNRWGDIVFEADPYNNDWDGTSKSGIIQNEGNRLLNGTYFYFFYKDKSKKDDLEKGFFEIKTNAN